MHSCVQVDNIKALWKKVDSYTNGNVKWWQLISVTVGVLSVVVIIFLWSADRVIANDRLREENTSELKLADSQLKEMFYKEVQTISNDIRELKTLVKYKNYGQV